MQGLRYLIARTSVPPFSEISQLLHMGKSNKKKHGARRFDPLARPSDAMMQDDDEAAPVEPEKPLSAHQQRHLERKRLQAEKIALKNQKAKVSKSDKLVWKEETKNIAKTLKANREALRKAGTHTSGISDRSASPQPASAPAAFTGFDLPAPRQVEVTTFMSS